MRRECSQQARGSPNLDLQFKRPSTVQSTYPILFAEPGSIQKYDGQRVSAGTVGLDDALSPNVEKVEGKTKAFTGGLNRCEPVLRSKPFRPLDIEC